MTNSPCSEDDVENLAVALEGLLGCSNRSNGLPKIDAQSEVITGALNANPEAERCCVSALSGAGAGNGGDGVRAPRGEREVDGELNKTPS